MDGTYLVAQSNSHTCLATPHYFVSNFIMQTLKVEVPMKESLALTIFPSLNP